MHLHLVFVAKYRRKIFHQDTINRLQGICAKLCQDFEAQLVEMDGEHDHAHLLVEYPPKIAVSSLVNSLKGVSSRLLREERPDWERDTLTRLTFAGEANNYPAWTPDGQRITYSSEEKGS